MLIFSVLWRTSRVNETKLSINIICSFFSWLCTWKMHPYKLNLILFIAILNVCEISMNVSLRCYFVLTRLFCYYRFTDAYIRFNFSIKTYTKVESHTMHLFILMISFFISAYWITFIFIHVFFYFIYLSFYLHTHSKN